VGTRGLAQSGTDTTTSAATGGRNEELTMTSMMFEEGAVLAGNLLACRNLNEVKQLSLSMMSVNSGTNLFQNSAGN